MPISRSGGGYGPPAADSVVSDFSTTFPSTENPLSVGGTFTHHGGRDGLDWQDMLCVGGTPGIAYGTGTTPSGQFTDNIATIQGRFTATKHFSQITIHKPDGAYTPPDSHEVEALVGFTIGANSARGYETDVLYNGSFGPVRWNGARGDYSDTVFTTVSGATFTVAHGDVLKTVFDSSSGSPVISYYLNGSGTPGWVVTDTTAGKIGSGSPGIGSFAHPGSGFDFTKHAIRGFSAGSA